MNEVSKEVSLREVTEDTVRAICRLSVGPGQEKFVASNAISIAEAYFAREMAWFRAVYAGEDPVGFVMVEDDEENREYFLWRFMIDAGHQGKGIGRRAMELVIEHVRSRPGATEFFTSCVVEPGGPGPFYEKLGFRFTGEVDEGEHVMKLDLPPFEPAST